MKRIDAVIVDIDGTVALMHNRTPFEWQKVDKDLPNYSIIELVQNFGKYFQIVFVSGRKEECREKTLKWLKKYGMETDYLFMRANNDNRPDTELKKEILETSLKENFNIKYVLDDRNQVVKMWRDSGFTCLQVAEGDF